MLNPIWLDNVRQDDIVEILYLERSNEWAIMIHGKDGILEDGFKTKQEVADRLESLGMNGWFKVVSHKIESGKRMNTWMKLTKPIRKKRRWFEADL